MCETTSCDYSYVALLEKASPGRPGPGAGGGSLQTHTTGTPTWWESKLDSGDGRTTLHTD